MTDPQKELPLMFTINSQCRRASLIALLVTSGCTVGPDYEPPNPSMPSTWSQPLGRGLVTGDFRGAAWWLQLGDTQLTDLIHRALQHNPSLGAALGRIRQSRALARQISAQYVPDIDGNGSYSRSRESGAAFPFPVPEQSAWSTGLSMVWEIDLFGRIQRSNESAKASFESSVENYRDVLTVLQAEVAGVYLQVRTLQRRIQLLEENIRLQKSSRDLAQARFETEISPELDVLQAASNLANTEAQLPGLELALTQALHRLAVLLGQRAGALRDELAKFVKLPGIPKEIAVGVPADLLRRRPDIRRAERQLAAQTARIGAAEALLYPQLSLSGAFGGLSRVYSNVFDANNRRWNVTPGFGWNIFDGGRVRGAVDEEEALALQARFQYENAILLAMEEAENAIAGFRRERERLEALQRVVVATKKAATLAEALYKQGLRNFQNVLDAQRSLTAAQDALALSEGQVVSALITLFRALGGGWDADAANTKGADPR